MDITNTPQPIDNPTNGQSAARAIRWLNEHIDLFDSTDSEAVAQRLKEIFDNMDPAECKELALNVRSLKGLLPSFLLGVTVQVMKNSL